jgi:steroid 5-alpha reductase family enzyme
MSLPNEQLLWITAVITILYQLSFFAIASLNRFDKVTDFAGSTNFFINAVVSLTVAGVRCISFSVDDIDISQVYSSKRVVVVACVLLWAVRLAAFLLLRVLRAGDDKRFDEMRDSFWKFLGFWVFQMIWVWTVGVSVTLLCASDDVTSFGSATDIAGLILFILGFMAEAGTFIAFLFKQG